MAGLSYDIIADLADAGLLRIQVKTTTCLHGRKLRFQMQRGFYNSRRGKFDYGRSDFDIAAFVYLPAGKVVFWAAPPRSVSIFPEWLDPVGVDHRSWLLALKHHEAFRRIRVAAAPNPSAGSAAP